MVKLTRFLMLSMLGATWLLSANAIASASTSTVECGQLVSYTAPEPLGPSEGSLTLGMLPAWAIAADATLSAAVEANLATLAGTGPSCLAMDRDDSDVITSLDFAAEGEIEGPTVYDAGMPGYVFANRLIVPSFITDAYPGLAAIFVNSEATGTEAHATFSVDNTTGRFTQVEATSRFCGSLDLANNGDGTVGSATIAAVLLEAKDTAILAAANGAKGCADVVSVGAVDGSGNLTVTSEIVITPAAKPTPPSTSTLRSDDAASHPEAGLVGFAALMLLIVTVAAVGRRSPARR